MATRPGTWLLALALALEPAGLWAQPRLVEAGGGLRVPRSTVLLSCRGSGFDFSSYAVRWYRQAASGTLEWVSYINYMGTTKNYAAAVQGRATVYRDNSQSQSSLSLKALHPRDSARYFCAILEPGGWTDKLIFGSGTTLTVEPIRQNRSVPEVIVMKSKKPEYGNTEKAACLAKNVYTKNIGLEMTSNVIVYDPSTPILTSKGLYDTIKVVNVTKGTEVTCTARFNGNTITAFPEEESEEPIKAKVCNTTDISAQDTKVEKANMLSMTVLGLRVLLAKSIAFNTLMSIKLFLF